VSGDDRRSVTPGLIRMEDPSTIGLLYPGEMGAALGRLLVSGGHRVVTTVRGRSDRTERLGREAGLVILDSMAEVVRQSRVVFSLVSPSAATEVADNYCALAHFAPASAIYVDVNSIGPKSAQFMAGSFSRAGVSFVDAAINGLAKNIASGGTLFLSGERAGDVVRLVDGLMRLRVLGSAVGPAKTMKMLLGGLSKGISALFLELACLAERRDLLPEMLEICNAVYPGVSVVAERMLPTYARHAERRAAEMRELEQTARFSELEPAVIRGIRELHEQLAQVSFAGFDPGIPDLVNEVLTNGLLAPRQGETVVR
jgi:3-hydroxyisobutyrate dehydrogenase-like beta-hydroxyacid dehydrogenase